MARQRQTFKIGDRVRALRPLSHGRVTVGATGRVVKKSASTCTGGWTITIRFQGVDWLVRVPCVGGYVEHASGSITGRAPLVKRE